MRSTASLLIALALGGPLACLGEDDVFVALDAGPRDAAPVDAGSSDASNADLGADAEVTDAGFDDASSPDADDAGFCPPCAPPPDPACTGTGPCGCGPYTCPDAGIDPDAGTEDAAADAGLVDAGSNDAGGPDAGPFCGAADEPDDELTAAFRGTFDDCTGFMMSGEMDSVDDIDVSYISGQDTLGCFVQPVATVTGGLRICLFVDCPNVSSSCIVGSVATSAEGRPGCCGLGNTELTLNCPGTTDDNADVYIWVEGGTEGQCIPYTVDFEY